MTWSEGLLVAIAAYLVTASPAFTYVLARLLIQNGMMWKRHERDTEIALEQRGYIMPGSPYEFTDQWLKQTRDIGDLALRKELDNCALHCKPMGSSIQLEKHLIKKFGASKIYDRARAHNLSYSEWIVMAGIYIRQGRAGGIPKEEQLREVAN